MKKRPSLRKKAKQLTFLDFFRFVNRVHFLVCLDGNPGYTLVFGSVRIPLFDLEKST